MIIFIGESPYPEKEKRYYVQNNVDHKCEPVAFITPELSVTKNRTLKNLLDVFNISISKYKDNYPQSLINHLDNKEVHLFNAYSDVHCTNVSADLLNFFNKLKEGQEELKRPYCPQKIIIVTWVQKAKRVLQRLPVLDNMELYFAPHPAGRSTFYLWKQGAYFKDTTSRYWLINNVKLK